MKKSSLLLTLICSVVISACSSSSNNNDPATGQDSSSTDNTTTSDADSTTVADSNNENTTSDTNNDNQSTVNEPPPPTANSATYRITFNATWSGATHPTQYPSNAHFSGLVGAVHNDQVNFWEPGQIATDGIEYMAETGGKSLFIDEINSAIASGYAQLAINAGGIAATPGTRSIEINVTPEFHNVTLTTMLAPSPDWFTGFHDIKLYDGATFVDAMTIEAVVYDSGTDSGLGFRSANSDTQPRDIIQRVTSDSDDTDFVNGLPVVGQFVIERL